MEETAKLEEVMGLILEDSSVFSGSDNMIADMISPRTPWEVGRDSPSIPGTKSVTANAEPQDSRRVLTSGLHLALFGCKPSVSPSQSARNAVVGTNQQGKARPTCFL